MLSEHSIAQRPRAQYGTIRVKAVRLLPKMYKFSARRADAAQALMVRSSRITSTAGYTACICCTYSRPTGYSFPSLRRSISAPILPRARHTHGLDSDSGFWIRIRIRIGLDYGRICNPSAVICHHPAVIFRQAAETCSFSPGFSGAHPTLGSRNTARPHLAEPDHVQACHGIHGSFITKMVLTNKWYMER